MKLLRPALAVLALVAFARADVLHVPSDFESVQDAVDVASPGDEIVIAAGTYEGVILIDGKVDLRLRGQGKVRLIGSVADTPNLLLQSCDDIVLERLIVADSEGAGIALDDCDEITIRRCRVENSAAAGIDLFNSNQILIDRVVVVDPGTAGLLAEGSDSVTATRCSFTGGDVGIDFLDGRSVLIDRSKVSGTTGRGIGFGVLSLTGPEESILRRCVVQDAGSFGISARGTALLIEDNRVIDSVGSGVDLLGGSILLRDNLIQRAGGDGISLGPGQHQVLDNKVIQAAAIGVLATGTGVATLSGNRVEKSGSAGVNLDVGHEGSVLVDNRVSTPGGDGITIFCDDVQVSGNRVTKAAHDGFGVFGSSSIFVGNFGKGCVHFDLFDDSTFGNTYVDNQFGTSQFP